MSVRTDAFDSNDRSSFLERALQRKENNILVHCSAGISRSPTLVLAYMMKKYRMTLEEAFDKMRQLRQIVDPNVSFIFQLRDWERSLQAPVDVADGDSARAAPSTYCGSTSKNKGDTTKCSDAAIIVN